MCKKPRETCKKARCLNADNILKNICDALNDIAYKDDIQIIEVTCRKFYTEEDEDYIEVYMEEIKKNEEN